MKVSALHSCAQNIWLKPNHWLCKISRLVQDALCDTHKRVIRFCETICFGRVLGLNYATTTHPQPTPRKINYQKTAVRLIEYFVIFNNSTIYTCWLYYDNQDLYAGYWMSEFLFSVRAGHFERQVGQIYTQLLPLAIYCAKPSAIFHVVLLHDTTPWHGN